jgi:hypothetical protein
MEEGKDFYFNSRGLMVFTAAYHLKRGYCCGSGCLHCPYRDEKKNAPGEGTLPENIDKPENKEKP